MSTPTAQASQSSWDLLYSILQIIVPLIGGSIATLLGMYFQRVFNQRDKVIEDVYDPLLLRLSNLSEGELAFQDDCVRIASVWEDLEGYQRRHLKEDISTDLDHIEELIDKIGQFFIYLEGDVAEHGSYNSSNNGILMSSRDVKPAIVFKKRGGHTQGYSIEKWICTYTVPLLEASNSSELESLLLEQAKGLGSEYEEAFRNWDDRQFEHLFAAIEDSSSRVEWLNDVGDRTDHFDLLQEKASELESKIKEEVDKSWIRIILPDI